MLIPFQELCSKYAIRPKGVVHIGAHHGEEGYDYARGGVERVIWIEAMPEAFKKLVANTIATWLSEKLTAEDNIAAHNGIVCVRACLSDVDGERVKFNVANNGQSSSLLELGTHTTAHPEVKFVGTLDLITARFDTEMKHHDLVDDIMPHSFLNIDVQGAELLVLRGMGDLLKLFDYAYIEVNRAELYKGCALVDEVDAYLATFGFEPVETKWCGNTNWGDQFLVRK